MKISRLFCISVFLLLGLSNAGWAMDGYRVVKLGLGNTASVAFDVNNQGAVVRRGGIPQGGGAFLYLDGEITDLGTLGGGGSEAFSLNNHNQVVGASRNASGRSHAFLYADGEMIDLGTLGGISSTATSINDKGHVVGTSRINSGSVTQAFLYQNNTGMLNLGVSEYGDSYAQSINNNGSIVGYQRLFTGAYRGFIYTEGSINYVNSLSRIFSINDNGIAVGRDSDGIPYIYDDGALEEIEPLPFASRFRPNDINNHGYIVGQMTRGGSSLAYVVDPDGVLTDLNSLVVGPSEFDTLIVASAINDNGWIAGHGKIGFVVYGFVLIPEPDDTDSDGIPDADDECPNSVLGDFASVGACVSTLADEVDASGCTVTDRVSICLATSENKGRFVSCTSDLLRSTQHGRQIRGAEFASLLTCAAKH